MILLAYGTRPEFIKIKPLIMELESNSMPFKVLFTGQQKDIAPKSGDFIMDMKNLDNNRLNSILKNCLSLPEEYFDNINYVLVQGDTSTALGLSLAAFHRKIKIIHLEAGLRTFDFNNPYPEEMNRQLISKMACIHFCPTEHNLQNLKQECIDGDIYVVGNTGLDNLISYKDNCKYTNTVLITLHRRENHAIIEKWFTEINNLAQLYSDLNFIFPIHPNPNVLKYKHILSYINVIDPLSHEELIKLLINTKLVITDSGGLQEECSYFNKKVLVCRKTTERPESIGQTSFMVDCPKKLHNIFNQHINDYQVNCSSPYGDGFSSKKIVNILKEKYSENI